MEKVLLYQNKHWNNEPYPGLFEREALNRILSYFHSNTIQVLTGIRRCGKSSIFKLLINDLITKHDPQSILFLNLDDPVFNDLSKDASKLYEVIEIAEKITGKNVRFLFLDEIQNVQNWEKFVKSVFDNKLFDKILITGSNSSMLEGDLASLLTGRFIVTEIHPLSFHEILQLNRISDYLSLHSKKPVVMGFQDALLEYGAFPEIVKNSDISLKRELAKGYFNSIITRDCIVKHEVRDKKTFTDLAHYLSGTYSSVFSFTSLAKAIGSNENTIKSFIEYLKDSFIIEVIQNHSYSLKTTKRSKNKPYWIDNGLINAVNYRFSENKGQLLENFVFTELYKKHGKNITFFNDSFECDFIVKDDDNTLAAIQVCYELTPQNRDREIKGLKEVQKRFNIDTLTLITSNQSEKIENIDIVPAWKYFSGMVH